MINERQLLDLAMKSNSINDYVDIRNRKYLKDISYAGMYLFWFDNRDKSARKLKRELNVDGPDRIIQKISWDWNLEDDKICLYVGKSTNIQKRLGLHLLLKTEKLYLKKTDKLIKKTTSCQLRSGFDYLYQNQQNDNIFDEISKRLFFSVIKEDDFIKRFYMEDLLVGKLIPWFNVDSER